jgi:hypothetical protein
MPQWTSPQPCLESSHLDGPNLAAKMHFQEWKVGLCRACPRDLQLAAKMHWLSLLNWFRLQRRQEMTQSQPRRNHWSRQPDAPVAILRRVHRSRS